MNALAGAADLKQIDRGLCKHAEVLLPLGHLEPTNSAEELARVGEDPKYSPRFRYAPQDGARLDAIEAELLAFVQPEEGVGIFFREARDYLLKRLDLLRHLGDDPAWAEPIYAEPPPRIINFARRILSQPRRDNGRIERPFGAEEQARLLRARLMEYGLEQWRVLVRPNISATNTDAANLVVNLRADATFTMEEMKGLVVHEVDTHVLRAANGYCQPYRIFAVGAVPSYLTTEEGLAVVNEERAGYIDTARTRLFAGRTLAARTARHSGFREVYTEQRDYGFTHKEAFLTAKRVKRGLSDAAAPGGYIKDHAYLWGRLQVEEYVLGGGDLARLYVGKVALEHLPILRELGLRPPRYLPYPYTG